MNAGTGTRLLAFFLASLSIAVAGDTNNLKGVSYSGWANLGPRPDGVVFLRDSRSSPPKGLIVPCGTSTNGIAVIAVDRTNHQSVLLAVDGETNWVERVTNSAHKHKPNETSEATR